jgi:hypothetical protein
VVVFALNDHQYQRWLKLESLQRRSPDEDAELAGYLKTIAAAEARVRRWVADYLRAERDRHQRQGCGAERAEVYRAVAPRLPAAWGIRQIARVYGDCRPGDDTFAGKMLILEAALQALCSSGRVEALPGPLGDLTFQWSAARAGHAGQEHEPARAGRRPARRKKGSAAADSPSPAATTARPDLRAFLTSRGRFVGLDE